MSSKLSDSEISNWYKKINFVRKQPGINSSGVTESSFAKKDTTDRTKAFINNIINTRKLHAFLSVSDYDVNSGNIVDDKKILDGDRTSIDDAVTSLLRICPNLTCKTVCQNTGINSNQINTNGICQNGLNAHGLNTNGNKSNVDHVNGTKTNGTNQHAFHSNVSLSNGVNRNGTNSDGTCFNTVQAVDSTGSDGYTNRNNDGTHMHGVNANGVQNNVTNTNGAHNNGKKSNSTNTNGTNGNVKMQNGSNQHGVCNFSTCGFGQNSNVVKSNGCTDQIYDPNTVTYSHKDHYTKEQAEERWK